mgnify:CR=1 FL=1
MGNVRERKKTIPFFSLRTSLFFFCIVTQLSSLAHKYEPSLESKGQALPPVILRKRNTSNHHDSKDGVFYKLALSKAPTK